MTDMEYTLDERVVRKLPADPAVIAEELDELWDEVKLNPRKNPQRNATMREEAIQVAAMAIRFVLDVCDKKVDEEQSGAMR